MVGAEQTGQWSSLVRRTEFRELLVRLDLEERATQRTIQTEGREDWNRRARLTRWQIVERLRRVSAEIGVPAELGELLTTLDGQAAAEHSPIAEGLRTLIVACLQRRANR